MQVEDMMIRLVNEDEMLYDCRIILEACVLLNISPCLADKWVNEYLLDNLKIEQLWR